MVICNTSSEAIFLNINKFPKIHNRHLKRIKERNGYYYTHALELKTKFCNFIKKK